MEDGVVIDTRLSLGYAGGISYLGRLSLKILVLYKLVLSSVFPDIL